MSHGVGSSRWRAVVILLLKDLDQGSLLRDQLFADRVCQELLHFPSGYPASLCNSHCCSDAAMAQPVLVRAYTGDKRAREGAPGKLSDAAALPPISSYAFADILRSVDGSRDFQIAIDGIAEICAKTRLSLADEYGAHLPPLGEITVATATAPRPQPRPGMRRVLTSVPEASSGSSEGSRKSNKKRGSIFSFRKQQQQQAKQDRGPLRQIRISSVGRTIPVGTTTAMAVEVILPESRTRSSSETTVVGVVPSRPASRARAASLAQSSLQRLLAPRRAMATG